MAIQRRAILGAAASMPLGAAVSVPFIRRARAQSKPVIKIGVMNDQSGPYRDVNGPTGVICTKQAVQEFADHAFATADNPRGEQVERIFDDMREGVADPTKITWIIDRRRAISLALDSAKAGDSLLIAGKGHEGYQEFADTVIPFDDRQVVRELIAIKALRT